MKSHIQFITTPTSDTPGTALILWFDDRRYLIGNLHEGIQRASIQRAIKLNKISNIFLTGKTEWKNTGGLIGMILTLADSATTAALWAAEAARLKLERQLDKNLVGLQGKKDRPTTAEEIRGTMEPKKSTLAIHGGPNLAHTIATARRFVFRKGMPVYVDELQETEENAGWKPTWSDDHIRVWAMSVEPVNSTDAVNAAEPRSHRKRSFDEFKDKIPLLDCVQPNDLQTSVESTLEQQDEKQQIRMAVVSDMFDSAWKLDALVETPLAQVEMPTTLFIRNPETKKIEKYQGPLPGGEDPLPDMNVLVRTPWPGALINDLPSTIPQKTAMSYIIRNHAQRGKFLPKKAKALNVNNVKLYSQLTAGKSVQSDDGKTVHPEDVLGEGKPGSGMAVIELPSREYIKGLVERAEWRVPEVMTGVGVVIWILGPSVGEDETLRNFMTEFNHLEHIVSSQDYCTNYLSLDSAASAAIRLNQIDPVRFPVPIHNNITVPQLELPTLQAPLNPCWIPASRGMTVYLEPSVKLEKESIIPPLNTAQVVEETPKEVLTLAKAAREEISTAEFQADLEKQNLPSPDAEIIFLGTGSASPSKYRNVSATLLRVPGCGSYLLDCGENTLGQLKRVYTPNELQDVLRDLKLIWISHLHADHHLGTTSVIRAWYETVYSKDYTLKHPPKYTLMDQLVDPAKIMREERRLFVASNSAMIKWLTEYASVEDYGYDKLIPLSVYGVSPGNLNSTKLDWNGARVTFNSKNSTLVAALRASTGLTNLATANVNHCHGAQAVSLTFPTGFKFSYSGDCRPSRSFAEIGQGSTVLLHEATFDDELKGDAEAKKHSTTSEAIGIGVAMGAKRVLLTHFSQRYQKLPVMEGVDSWSIKDEEISDEVDDGVEVMVGVEDEEGNRQQRDDDLKMADRGIGVVQGPEVLDKTPSLIDHFDQDCEKGDRNHQNSRGEEIENNTVMDDILDIHTPKARICKSRDGSPHRSHRFSFTTLKHKSSSISSTPTDDNLTENTTPRQKQHQIPFGEMVENDAAMENILYGSPPPTSITNTTLPPVHKYIEKYQSFPTIHKDFGPSGTNRQTRERSLTADPVRAANAIPISLKPITPPARPPRTPPSRPQSHSPGLSTFPTSSPPATRFTKGGASAHADDAVAANDMKIGVAFDYMRVKVRDIACLEKFTPALRKLYEHALKEEEEKEKKKKAIKAV